MRLITECLFTQSAGCERAYGVFVVSEALKPGLSVSTEPRSRCDLSDVTREGGAGPTLDNLRTTSLLPRPTVLERKPHRRPRSAASCSRTHAERRRRTAEVRRGNWPAGWHHHSITCTAAQSHLVTSSPSQLLSHTWWHHHLLSHTWALYLRHISGQLPLKGHSGDFQRFL